MKFLQWCADPTNACGSKDRKLEKATLNNITFENHPDYEVTKITPGKLDTIHVLYKPPTEQDDEKVRGNRPVRGEASCLQLANLALAKLSALESFAG